MVISCPPACGSAGRAPPQKGAVRPSLPPGGHDTVTGPIIDATNIFAFLWQTVPHIKMQGVDGYNVDEYENTPFAEVTHPCAAAAPSEST